MKTYTFEKAFSQGWVKIEIQAASYKEALDGLIFQIGSEADAAKYNFVGEDLSAEIAEIYDSRRLTEEDVDHLAEITSEGRTYNRTDRVNYHE